MAGLDPSRGHRGEKIPLPADRCNLLTTGHLGLPDKVGTGHSHSIQDRPA